MIVRALRALLLAGLGWLAWIAWQPPTPAPNSTPETPAPVAAPAQPRETAGAAPRMNAGEPAANRETGQAEQKLWRVVTRRIVWPEAAKTLEQRLRDAGLSPIVIRRREEVTMHAFDDATIYHDRKQAKAALRDWRKRHMDATLIKAAVEPGKEAWIVGLGRFYLTEYAEQMQARLRRIGKPYRYERRNVRLPVWRFAFAPMPRDQAEALWRRLQDMGIAAPALMPEEEFRRFQSDNAPADAAGDQPPINSAKRSNR